MKHMFGKQFSSWDAEHVILEKIHWLSGSFPSPLFTEHQNSPPPHCFGLNQFIQIAITRLMCGWRTESQTCRVRKEPCLHFINGNWTPEKVTCCGDIARGSTTALTTITGALLRVPGWLFHPESCEVHIQTACQAEVYTYITGTQNPRIACSMTASTTVYTLNWRYVQAMVAFGRCGCLDCYTYVEPGWTRARAERHSILSDLELHGVWKFWIIAFCKGIFNQVRG